MFSDNLAILLELADVWGGVCIGIGQEGEGEEGQGGEGGEKARTGGLHNNKKIINC